MELRKIYSRVEIHKLMESLFNTFVIYSSLKLQIYNPLGVLLGVGLLSIYMEYLLKKKKKMITPNNLCKMMIEYRVR
jgi:hypothetical protein